MRKLLTAAALALATMLPACAPAYAGEWLAGDKVTAGFVCHDESAVVHMGGLYEMYGPAMLAAAFTKALKEGICLNVPSDVVLVEHIYTFETIKVSAWKVTRNGMTAYTLLGSDGAPKRPAV